MTRVLVTFIKGMVGSYLLYLPKVVHNGGIVASTLMLFVAALIASDNILVLLRCAEVTGKNAYGQIGQEALGRPGLLMVDASLILSQLSFCSSYYTFMTKNIPSVIPQQAPGSFAEWILTPDALILAQIMVYVPMVMIRNLKYMAVGMFLANVCLWTGAVVILAMVVKVLAENGPQPVLLFNPDTFWLSLGALVVTFEGIGLVLPVRESLEPHLQHKYPHMIVGVMIFLAIFFGFFSCIGYITYGDDIETFITTNLPDGHPVTVLAVVVYCVAILFSYPLQFFPAIKCLERHLFIRPGGPGNRCQMWLKNILRTVLVLLTALVGRYAGPSFDNFAGLIGGFCAVPLALLYPVVFQLYLFRGRLSLPRLCWSWLQLATGVCATIVCSWEALSTWK